MKIQNILFSPVYAHDVSEKYGITSFGPDQQQDNCESRQDGLKESSGRGFRGALSSVQFLRGTASPCKFRIADESYRIESC